MLKAMRQAIRQAMRLKQCRQDETRRDHSDKNYSPLSSSLTFRNAHGGAAKNG